MALLKRTCHRRTQIAVPYSPALEPGLLYMPENFEVEVGGAIVFVANVSRFERITHDQVGVSRRFPGHGTSSRRQVRMGRRHSHFECNARIPPIVIAGSDGDPESVILRQSKELPPRLGGLRR